MRGISLEALSLGATDYIAKPTTDQLNASEDFRRDLIEKVDRAGPRAGRRRAGPPDASPLSRQAPLRRATGSAAPAPHHRHRQFDRRTAGAADPARALCRASVDSARS